MHEMGFISQKINPLCQYEQEVAFLNNEMLALSVSAIHRYMKCLFSYLFHNIEIAYHINQLVFWECLFSYLDFSAFYTSARLYNIITECLSEGH